MSSNLIGGILFIFYDGCFDDVVLWIFFFFLIFLQCELWKMDMQSYIHYIYMVRLAEWSKAWDLSSHNRKIAWVRTPHLTQCFLSLFSIFFEALATVTFDRILTGGVAIHCNPATGRSELGTSWGWELSNEVDSCWHGVRTKAGINMVISGEPEVIRLLKEMRTGREG